MLSSKQVHQVRWFKSHFFSKGRVTRCSDVPALSLCERKACAKTSVAMQSSAATSLRWETRHESVQHRENAGHAIKDRDAKDWECIGVRQDERRDEVNGKENLKRRFIRTSLFVLAMVCVNAVVCALLPPLSQAATASTEGMSSASSTLIEKCLSFVLHLDKHLQAIIAQFGETKTYLLLTGIVFCETGLVITPFLPGDSLLFACGAFAALGSLKLQVVILTLCMAAIAGDAVNYLVGHWVGQRIISSGIISEKHIKKTESFYDKHGGKTVVMARFVPIVRTFAPFVAGIGSMNFSTFTLYNVVGALVWTISFTLLGYFFGNLPFVQHNFTLVVLGIVAISVLPVLYEVFTASKE